MRQIPRDEKQANLSFYERVTTHDSSLTTSIFSINNAELGHHQPAYDYFQRTLSVDSLNTVGNTGVGIHAAAMAGSWGVRREGVCWLRTCDGMLYLDPYLPEKWEKYSFKIKFSQSALAVNVSRRDVTYTLIDGDKICIKHGQTLVHLAHGKPVTVRLYRDVRNLAFDAMVFDLGSIISFVETDHYTAWKAVLDPFFASV